MSLCMIWLTIGVSLAILELIIPGTYLIWFGFAALVVSGMTFFMPGMAILWQLVWL